MGPSTVTCWVLTVSLSVVTDKPRRNPVVAAAYSMRGPTTSELGGGAGGGASSSNNNHNHHEDEAAASASVSKTEREEPDSSSDSTVPIPLLPPPSDGNGSSNIPRIQLGESISFEELGPVIINSDGTTRRIDNWDEMSPHEREVAWRRISKRNEERRQKLMLVQQQQEQSDLETE